MENVSESKAMKQTRSNHGSFIMMYTYKIGAKQWTDLVEKNEEQKVKEGESMDDFIQRKIKCNVWHATVDFSLHYAQSGQGSKDSSSALG